MDPLRQKNSIPPWRDRLNKLYGERESRGVSKHTRGTTPSPNARATRKAKRRRSRFARAITHNWPRKRQK